MSPRAGKASIRVGQQWWKAYRLVSVHRGLGKSNRQNSWLESQAIDFPVGSLASEKLRSRNRGLDWSGERAFLVAGVDRCGDIAIRLPVGHRTIAERSRWVRRGVHPGISPARAA